MRFDLFLVLFVVTFAACRAPRTSASSNLFNRHKERNNVARALRVRPDDEGEEERIGFEKAATTVASEINAGVSKTAEAATPMIPKGMQMSDVAARKVTGKTIDPEDVLKKVPGLDDEFMMNFKMLPKERQDDILEFMQQQAQSIKDTNVKESTKAFKAWYKSATEEEKKLSPAEQLKAAGVVESRIPNKQLNALMEMSATFHKLNKPGIKKFLKFMGYVGLVGLGAFLMGVVHWLKGPSTSAVLAATVAKPTSSASE